MRDDRQIIDEALKAFPVLGFPASGASRFSAIVEFMRRVCRPFRSRVRVPSRSCLRERRILLLRADPRSCAPPPLHVHGDGGCVLLTELGATIGDFHESETAKKMFVIAAYALRIPIWQNAEENSLSIRIRLKKRPALTWGSLLVRSRCIEALGDDITKHIFQFAGDTWWSGVVWNRRLPVCSRPPLVDFAVPLTSLSRHIKAYFQTWEAVYMNFADGTQAYAVLDDGKISVQSNRIVNFVYVLRSLRTKAAPRSLSQPAEIHGLGHVLV